MAEEKGPVMAVVDGLRENVKGFVSDFQSRRMSMMATRTADGGILGEKGILGGKSILGNFGNSEGGILGGKGIFGNTMGGIYGGKGILGNFGNSEGGILGGKGILGGNGLKIGNGELLKKIPRPLGLIKFGQGDTGNDVSTTSIRTVDDRGDFTLVDAATELAYTPKRVRGH